MYKHVFGLFSDQEDSSSINSSASVSMIHSLPELKVTVELAMKLGKADEERLLKDRKLVLLVDLDQTLIHSTNENIPLSLEGVEHYQLYGSNTPWYHTKLRPHTMQFLQSISKFYELHICTFGARMYAHKIANILDPSKQYFSHRILSRDECFDPTLKTGNLKALFPCGDSMVAIIDDREDVWNFASNLVAVKPYFFFKNTGDINSPCKPKGECLFHDAKKLENENETKQVLIESQKASDNDNLKSDTIVQTTSEQAIIDDKNEKNEKQSESSQFESGEKQKTKEKEEKDIDPAIKTNSEETAEIEGKANQESEGQESENANDEDDYLLYLRDILIMIHQKYYKLYDEIIKFSSEGEHVKLPDLKEIIPSLRKSVLRGVNLVFSGVVPTNMQLERSKFYLMAKSLGANVTKDIILDGSPLEKTTHLMASKYGTAKVNKALKSENIYIVNLLWLYSCAERWERAEEKLFPLEKNDDYNNLLEKRNRQTVHQKAFIDTASEKVKSIQANEKTDFYPVYDPTTGKRLGMTKKKESLHEFKEYKNEQCKINENETISPQNMLHLSPLSGFSKNDLQLMDKEVDDACSEGDEMSTGNTESEEERNEDEINEFDESVGLRISSDQLGRKYDKRKHNLYDETSDEESNNSEYPKGWMDTERESKRKISRILGEEETCDSFAETTRSDDSSNEDDEYNESIGSVDEEMAAAVEKEFLS